MSGMDFLRHFIFCTVKFDKHSLRTHCVPDGKLRAKDRLLNETALTITELQSSGIVRY